MEVWQKLSLAKKRRLPLLIFQQKDPLFNTISHTTSLGQPSLNLHTNMAGKRKFKGYGGGGGKRGARRKGSRSRRHKARYQFSLGNTFWIHPLVELFVIRSSFAAWYPVSFFGGRPVRRLI